MPRKPNDGAAARAELLARWQACGKSAKPWPLTEADAAARPFSGGSKQGDRLAVQALAAEIDKLQDTLFADRRCKVLVVLQGMDTAGKDGTIRDVFGQVSPMGVRTMSWRAPTDEERDHDFLWRIHQRVPGAGELVIFNRSHYEDVLVPLVNGQLKPGQVRQRYRQINDFERLLIETGTVLLKFMLHVSAKEQRQRLQDRIDDPAKAWKFVPNDLVVRTHWNEYRKAYQALLGATGTALAPWTVVPADSKTHRNLMIATVVRDTLRSLRLRYPPRDPRLDGVKVE